MLEYGVAVGGATGGGIGGSAGGGGFGGSGALDQLQAMSSNPIALAVAAGFVVLILKFLR